MSSIVKNRDNAYPVRLYVGGVRVTDLSGVTRWICTLGGVTIDSSGNGSGMFDVANEDAGGDLLLCAFGTVDLPEGVWPMRVTYFDSTYTGGRQCDTVPGVVVRATATGTAAEAA